MILSELFTIVLIPTILQYKTAQENNTSSSIENKTYTTQTLVELPKDSKILKLIPESILAEIKKTESTNNNKTDIEDVLQILQSDFETISFNTSESQSTNTNDTVIENAEDDIELLLARSGFTPNVQNNNRDPKSQFKWYWPFSSSHQNPSKLDEESKLLECSQIQTEYNGQCYNVLQQLPCPTGQWLIEDEISKKGKCVENKCAGKIDTAFFDGQCVKIKSEDLCRPGMRTYIFKSGQVECDCKDGYIYNEEDGNCYEAFRQGPCKKNEYFAIPKRPKFQISSSKPSCIPNPCFLDGYFCNASSCPSKKRKNPWGIYGQENMPRNCAKFGSPCTTDGRGLFVIHPDTNSPFCQENISDTHVSFRIVGNVPTLKCAPGSRRDILGNCRPPADIEFS